YQEDEIALLGPNLPHEWRSEVEDYPDYYTRTMSVHFMHHFLGERIYELPESLSLIDLLKKSSKGIRVTDLSTKAYIRDRLIELSTARGFERIILLLQILETISNSPGLEY